MKRIIVVPVVLVAAAGVVALMAFASAEPDRDPAPSSGIKIPAGCGDWRLISVSHKGSNLNDLIAFLGA